MWDDFFFSDQVFCDDSLGACVVQDCYAGVKNLAKESLTLEVMLFQRVAPNTWPRNTQLGVMLFQCPGIVEHLTMEGLSLLSFQ